MIEEIDIGGVALLRARGQEPRRRDRASHDPAQYAEVLDALERGVTPSRPPALGAATFARTARYDAAIATELARRMAGDPNEPPALHALVLERARTLRYGENPHQVRGAVRARRLARRALARGARASELSYNNLLDLEAAVALVGRFERPACVIVKHNQPCGAACADTLEDAYSLALPRTTLSAFGGIVAFNRPLDGETARALARRFVECVAFPELDARG